jgi:hypothetical protein
MSAIEFKFVPEFVLEAKGANVPMLGAKKCLALYKFQVTCKLSFHIFFVDITSKENSKIVEFLQW